MTTKYLIWDLPLRIFHWVLVATIAAAWYTSDQDNGFIDYHLICGYVALGLITFRVLWGFLGTRHSQFKNFIPTPSKLISYVKKDKHMQEPAGHNPLGSLMVVFMLTIILLQAVSGLFMNDDIFTAGPYNGAIDKDIEAILVFIHRNSFDFILGAIALHIIAIISYKKFKNKSLVLPMITGKKSSDDVSEKDAIKHSKIILAIIIALAVAAFVYWLVVMNAPVAEEYYY
jgi:cytochrome b